MINNSIYNTNHWHTSNYFHIFQTQSYTLSQDSCQDHGVLKSFPYLSAKNKNIIIPHYIIIIELSIKPQLGHKQINKNNPATYHNLESACKLVRLRLEMMIWIIKIAVYLFLFSYCVWYGRLDIRTTKHEELVDDK